MSYWKIDKLAPSMHIFDMIKAKSTKVMFRDYFCFVLVLTAIVFIVIPWMIPALIILIPVMFSRIRFIKRVLRTGQSTTGVVTQKTKERRWGWIYRYAYTVAGTQYVTRNVVAGFKIPVHVNDPVEVVYNPQKPQQAFLPIFYLPTPRKLG